MNHSIVMSHWPPSHATMSLSIGEWWPTCTPQHVHWTNMWDQHSGNDYCTYRLHVCSLLSVFQFKPSKRFNQYRLREGTGLHLATSRIKLKLNTSWGKTVIFSDWSDSSVKIIYALLYFRSKVKRLWLFVWSFSLASVLLHYRGVTSWGRCSQASSLRTSLVDKEDVFIRGGSAGLHQQTQLQPSVILKSEVSFFFGKIFSIIPV